jgi:hypothetical protein
MLPLPLLLLLPHKRIGNLRRHTQAIDFVTSFLLLIGHRNFVDRI